MITTADEALADLFRLLRAHGWSRNARRQGEAVPGFDPRYTFMNWGFNVRPTELQAGFGHVQLDRWPQFRERRAENARYVGAALAPFGELALMAETAGGECAWFGLPFMVAADAPFGRDEITEHLEAMGIETRPIVAGNVTRHPAAQLFPDLLGQHLPGSDAVHDRGFYLGIHPIEHRDTLDRLIEVVADYVGRQR